MIAALSALRGESFAVAIPDTTNNKRTQKM
jgi:hypothetical protein